MGRGLRYVVGATLGLVLAGGLAAQTQPPQTQPQQTPPTQAQVQQPQTAQTPEHLVITPSQPGTEAEVIDRIIAREHQEVAMLRHYSPIVETYIQDMPGCPTGFGSGERPLLLWGCGVEQGRSGSFDASL